MVAVNSAKDILKRIDKRLKTLNSDGVKLSDRALSIAATGSPDTMRSIRRNVGNGTQHGISTDTLTKLAPHLQTTAEWLMSGAGAEVRQAGHVDSEHVPLDAAPTFRTVRIVGYVGAGSTTHYYAISDEDYEEVPAPTGASNKTVAVEIKGKSFGPLMDSWLVFYDDVRSPVTEDLLGEICVVGLADDRILIKQIRRERDGSFSLYSNSNEEPIRDAQIEWAARVKDMRPRV